MRSLYIHGRGLGLRGMGVLYSFLCLMSSLGMGSMVQANSAISTMEYTWHVQPWPAD